MNTKQRKDLPKYPIDHPTCISAGNPKIGPIPNISFPPVVSCQPNVPCAKDGCYALKAWKQYPGTVRAWTHNWDKLKHNRDAFFDDIHKHLTIKPRQRKFPVFLRWHVGGDIPDQDYLSRMKDHALEHRGIYMMAFTKNYSLNLGGLPQNLVVIPSAWPKFDMPEEISKQYRVAWVYDEKNVDKRIRTNYYTCNGSCTNCWACWHINEIGKDVVFHKH